MIDIYTDTITIYNIIPARTPQPIRYSRRVVPNCSIQGGFVDKSSGTARLTVNATTIITKDIEHYKPPTWEIGKGYYAADNFADWFTATAGDFIVFADVPDIITTASELAALKSKYKEISITITQAWARLRIPSIAHIEMTNV